MQLSKLEGQIVDKVMDDDAAWFDKNPSRKYRIRDFVFRELQFIEPPPKGYSKRTVVMRVAPGVRARQMFNVSVQVSNEHLDSDLQLREFIRPDILESGLKPF